MQPEDRNPIKQPQSIHDIIRDNEQRRILQAKRRKAEWALEAEREYHRAYDELVSRNTDYLRGWIKRNKKRIISNVIDNNQTRYGRKCYNKSYRLFWFSDWYYKEFLRYHKEFEESQGRVGYDYDDEVRNRPQRECRQERNHKYDQASIDAYLSEIFQCEARTSFIRVSVTKRDKYSRTPKYYTKHYDYFEILIPVP